MKFMVILLAFTCYLGITKSSLHELPVHPGVGGLYRGPNSETIIKGPDGSVITAEAQGGSVYTQPNIEPIVIPEPSPTAFVDTAKISSAVLADIASVAAVPVATIPDVVAAPPPVAVSVITPPILTVPAVITATAVPVVHSVEIIQSDPHIIEKEIVDSPPVEPQESWDLVGPSGSISTRGSNSVVSGPASTTISEPAKILVAPPLVAAIPVVSSIKTPLQPAPVAEIVPDVPAAVTSVQLQPTVPSSTLSPQINRVGVSSEITVSTVSTVSPLSASTVAVDLTDRDSLVQISSTIRPELVIASTTGSTIAPQQDISQIGLITNHHLENSLDHALINNRQLSINPSLIPAANIIPPEIGLLPPGAVDLGTTITVSSTPKIPVTSTTFLPNIQKADKANRAAVASSIRGADRKLNENQQISVQNQIVVSNSGKTETSNSLVLPTNPFAVHIPQNGIIGSELAKQGIDSSQIHLTNVPLSSTTLLSSKSRLPFTLSENVDDGSSVLWNRYGRDADSENNKNDENYKN